MKQTQKAMVVHKEVEPLQVSTGTSYFDEDEDMDKYSDCDPFSKLKYDDLRKVYRDQIVLPSSEKDFLKKPQYSLEQYARKRDSELGVPLSDVEAERQLALQRNVMEQRHLQKMYNSQKQLLVNEEKQSEFMSYLLRLK
jgi:hypothetical protein